MTELVDLLQVAYDALKFLKNREAGCNIWQRINIVVQRVADLPVLYSLNEVQAKNMNV